MGASAREIEREIKDTRDRMDENLTRLEGSAATKAARYGRIVVVGAGVLAVAAVAFIVYRRRSRKPTLRDRLEGVSLERVRELVERLRDELPTVTVTVNDKSESEPSMFEEIARKVAPALIGTASTAVLERVSRPPSTESEKS